MTTVDLNKYNLTAPGGLSDAIAALLDSKKGKDVVTVNLEGKTIIADYFVIASAFSTTAVKRVFLDIIGNGIGHDFTFFAESYGDFQKRT